MDYLPGQSDDTVAVRLGDQPCPCVSINASRAALAQFSSACDIQAVPADLTLPAQFDT